MPIPRTVLRRTRGAALPLFLVFAALLGSARASDPTNPDRQLLAVRLEGKWSAHRGEFPGGPGAGADPALDVSRWERVTVPEKGEAGAQRTTWYRTEFHWGQRHEAPAFLVLGRVDGEDALYLNGLPIGGTAGEAARGTNGRRARIHRLEGPWLKQGRNVIAVRVDGLDGAAGRIVGGPLRLASGVEARRLLGPGRMEPELAPAANFGIAAQADARGRLLGRVVAESALSGPLEIGWGSLSIADRDSGVELALDEFEKNELDLRWPMASFRAADRRLGDLRVEGEMFAPLAWREEWICALPLVMIDLRFENRGSFAREIEVVLRFHERLEREVTELSGFEEISSRLGYSGIQFGPLALALEGAVEPDSPLPGFLRLVASTTVEAGEVKRVRAALAYREQGRRLSESDPGVEGVIDIAWSQWQKLRDQSVGFDRGLPATGDAELDAAFRAYASFATRRTSFDRAGIAFIRTETRDPAAAAEESFYVSSAHLTLWPVLEELMVVSWSGKILAELPTAEAPTHVLPHLWYAARAIRLARWRGAATRVTPDIARAFKRSVAVILRGDRDGDGLPEPGPGEDRTTVYALALHVLEAATQASSSLRLDADETAAVANRLARSRDTVLGLSLSNDPARTRRRANAWIFPSSATLEFLTGSLGAVDAQATPCGIAAGTAEGSDALLTEPGLDYLDALGRARLGFQEQALELARRALRADLGADRRRPPTRFLVGCEREPSGREGARNATFLLYATQGWLGWSRKDEKVEVAPWTDPELPDLESNVIVPEGFIGWRRKARPGGWTLGFESVLLYPLEVHYLIRLAPNEGVPTMRALTPPPPTKPASEGEAPTPAEPAPAAEPKLPAAQKLEIVERHGARFALVVVRVETGHGARFEIDRAR
ncbi:MAG: hypothetical protein IPN34_09075 [Planctomycetes bacterium]|nr:hypothetical protein [Planctomycetota bacterium]